MKLKGENILTGHELSILKLLCEMLSSFTNFLLHMFAFDTKMNEKLVNVAVTLNDNT